MAQKYTCCLVPLLRGQRHHMMARSSYIQANAAVRMSNPAFQRVNAGFFSGNAIQPINTAFFSGKAFQPKFWESGMISANYKQPLLAPKEAVQIVRFTSKEQAPQISKPSTWVEKETVEKYCFRTLAFLIENGIIIFNWLVKAFQKYVLDNPKVQEYWKMLEAKMEKAKQN